MSLTNRWHIRALFQAEFLSAKDCLLRALFICGLFLVVHLAGLREHTSFLCGTATVPGMSWQWVAFFGATYLFVYFAFILGVPILLLAALGLWLWSRFDKTH